MTGFEEIYQRYFKDVFLFLKGLTKDEHLAEELTEETFFKALEALDSFHGESDIRVWLCQIAKNLYFSYLRKNKKQLSLEEQEEINEFSHHVKTVEEQFINKEEAMRIHCILHDMKEPYKEVFSLRVFGELSFKQIGSIFEKTENWACVTYHRARLMLRQKMEEKHG